MIPRRRTYPRLLCAACLALAMFAAPQAAAAATPECRHAREIPTRSTVPEARRALLCLINVVRTAAGAPIVHTVAALRTAAKRYARRMVDERFFAHDSPQGTSVEDRARETGFMNRIGPWEVGETLAWAQDRSATPRAMLYYWLASRAHRSVILDPHYRHVGIGIAYGAPEQIESDSTAATYALTFGTRPPASR